MHPKIREAANVVSADLDAHVAVYTGPIDEDSMLRLMESIYSSDEPKDNVFLILATNGGSAHIAYKIARLFQTTFKTFYLFVPTRCKSAGTIIALGANIIMMDELAELGPLDVQLVKRDEIGQRRSGLIVRTALAGLADETLTIYEQVRWAITTQSRHSVSFEVASKIASNIATAVMQPVYAQIDPEALGSDLRDLNVAKAYGQRLVERGGNASLSTVNSLVEGYPAHGFVIDRIEAKKLFSRVEDPSDNIRSLWNAIRKFIDPHQDDNYSARLDGSKGEENATDNEGERTSTENPERDEDEGVAEDS